MSFCTFSQLATIFIFCSAWYKSHAKWDNSQNSTQKMRTQDNHFYLQHFLITRIFETFFNKLFLSIHTNVNPTSPTEKYFDVFKRRKKNVSCCLWLLETVHNNKWYHATNVDVLRHKSERTAFRIQSAIQNKTNNIINFPFSHLQHV